MNIMDAVAPVNAKASNSRFRCTPVEDRVSFSYLKKAFTISVTYHNLPQG